jgi:hypothetical protein
MKWMLVRDDALGHGIGRPRGCFSLDSAPAEDRLGISPAINRNI